MAYSVVGVETASKHDTGPTRTITVNIPSGVQEGDVLFLGGVSSGLGSSPQPTMPSRPEGWTTLPIYRPLPGQGGPSGVHYRVVDGTEGGSITVNHGASGGFGAQALLGVIVAIRPDESWNRTSALMQIVDAERDYPNAAWPDGPTDFGGQDPFRDPNSDDWPNNIDVPESMTGPNICFYFAGGGQVCGAQHDDELSPNCFPDDPLRVLPRCSDCFTHFIASPPTLADVSEPPSETCVPWELTDGRGATLNGVVKIDQEPAHVDWVSDHPVCDSNQVLTFSVRMWHSGPLGPSDYGWGLHFPGNG